jgi:hypothetical protein
MAGMWHKYLTFRQLTVTTYIALVARTCLHLTFRQLTVTTYITLLARTCLHLVSSGFGALSS